MIDRGKRSVFGVEVDVCDYEAATTRILTAAAEQRPLAVTALAVHGLVTAARDPAYRARINTFDLVTPDGQPVRWALNDLHHAGLVDRVYGPFLTDFVLAGCAEQRLPVFFYGTVTSTLDRLVANCVAKHPGLVVAGTAPSRFGTVGLVELDAIARSIRETGARVVFVGLGCPRQEQMTYALRDRVGVPTLAVGAAFDYDAGTLTMPPPWVARVGLEWAYRLLREPGRLWRRYLVTNSYFLYAWTRARLRRTPDVRTGDVSAHPSSVDEAIPA